METLNHCDVVDGKLVAPRDLRAGEVILSEKALFVAPRRQGYAACVGCNMAFADGSAYCAACGMHVCSDACPHEQNECALFTASGVTCAVEDFDDTTLTMDFLGGLRLLLAVKNDQSGKLRSLLLRSVDAHNDKRKIKYNVRFFIGCEDMIVRFIRDTCKLQGFSDEEILTAVGLAEMYSVPVPGAQTGAKAFHVSACLMESDCAPNSYANVNALPDGSVVLVVKASTDIKKGQKITRCYGDNFKCTYFRRLEIEDTFMFECACSRCRDPSEFGTGLSGVHCAACPDGVLMPTDAFRPKETDWRCDKCAGRVGGEEAAKMLELLEQNIHEAMANAQGSVDVLQFLLTKRGEWDRAPKSGQLFLDVKRQLLSLVGNVPSQSYEFVEADLIHDKIKYCQEILAVLDKIHPGLSYNRAVILYEYVSSVFALEKRKLPCDQLKSDLSDRVQEAIDATKNEPEESIYRWLNEKLLQLQGQLQ